jgi:hypothetical protein
MRELRDESSIFIEVQKAEAQKEPSRRRRCVSSEATVARTREVE